MQEGNQKHASTLGMYVHVPFCSSTCDFCAFYQERPSKKRIKSYFLSLKDEMLRYMQGSPFDTVFIGGGTPGLLKPEELDTLCILIKELGLKKGAEWTIELAPNEVSSEKLSVLKNAGVNRISLGVQTFDAKLMDALGRKHGPDKVYKAYDLIQKTNFESVNLDLIFGIPGQSLAQWETDMMHAVDLKPNHLSTYCLTFEEDTALYAKLSAGEISIDPEREAEFYERAWSYLPHHGYKQYEISNFALDGYSCLHNLNTWKMNEWIGFGPSACSQYQNKRWKNPANLEKWESGVRAGFSSKDYDEFSELSEQTLAEDAILFGLRMNQGIKIYEIGQRFGLSRKSLNNLSEFFKCLIKENLAIEIDSSVCLTTEGRIRADAIAAEVPPLRVQES